MKLSSIKIIKDKDLQILENTINEWIRANESLSVDKITITENNNEFMASIQCHTYIETEQEKYNRLDKGIKNLRESIELLQDRLSHNFTD